MSDGCVEKRSDPAIIKRRPMTIRFTASRGRLCRFLLGVTLVLGIGGFAVSWVVAGRLVAASPRQVGEPPMDLNAVAFTVPSDSGSTISGWHTVPAPCRGAVILLHGIRGSRLSMVRRARLLHAEGFATVMIDLQAHGESPGEAITLGHSEQHDARAAAEFARGQHPGKPIGLIGVSLGGAAAVLASPLNIDAAVIESVYPNVDTAIHNRVSARLGWFAALPSELLLVQLQPRLGVARSELRPIDRMEKVGCPVLIASGAADLHTTAAETQAMYDAAREPKACWLVEGAAHVDLLSHAPAEYQEQVVGFLTHYLLSGNHSSHQPNGMNRE